jgi:hypothetical protein
MIGSIYFVGNSHLDQFIVGSLNLPVPAGTLCVPGASIRGLTNPVSRTGLNTMIRTADKDEALFVFHLGQVDIEFGYFYKSALQGKKLDVDAYIEEMIQRYESFLQSLRGKCMVIGVNPTVITDMVHIFRVNFQDAVCSENNALQETGCWNTSATFDSLRHIYDVSQTELTGLLKMANTAIKSMCLRNGFRFLDVWPILADESDQVVREFRPTDLNHHIVPSAILSAFLGHALQDAIFHSLVQTASSDTPISDK